jgi:Leucine-rich repeat (LRR) protein
VDVVDVTAAHSELTLHTNPDLGGPLPSKMSLLTALRTIDISDAAISGTVPVLAPLTRLQSLSLSINQLTQANNAFAVTSLTYVGAAALNRRSWRLLRQAVGVTPTCLPLR